MKKAVILGCENSHANYFADFIRTKRKYHDVEIIGAYSQESEALKKFCDKYKIKPMENYDSEVGNVDGVIVTARHGGNHLKYALPYFKDGMTAFIDKPVTIKEEEALALVREARKNNVKLTGGSSLRFAEMIENLSKRSKEEKGGRTIGGFMRFPVNMDNPYGGFFFYSQHLAESMGCVFGHYPVSVKAFRTEKTVTAVFRYENFDAVGVGTDGSYKYYAARITENGTEGGEFEIADSSPCFLKEFDEFYELLSGKAQVASDSDFIAPVFVLNAIYRSLESGKEEKVHRF